MSGWLLLFSPVATLIKQIAAAIAFYTILPVPTIDPLAFQVVARFAPLVGVFVGSLLGLLHLSLTALGMPALTTSVCIGVAWIALTGGLHLDGAMDSADGLATQNPERRLAVMTDSASGAFGVMAAIAIMALKLAALTDLSSGHWVALMGAAGWGRWGQQVAIVRYPYLKETGKGAFHKAALTSHWDLLPGLLLLLGLSGIILLVNPNQWPLSLTLAIGGSMIAWATGAWFHRQLGGHTGDTYGAVVEWTEALLLGLLTLVR